MLGLSKVLVIEESMVFLTVMERVLSPHAQGVLTAHSAREGRRKIAEHADISLVLSQVSMAEGDGFHLLEYVASLGEPRPRVILLAAEPVEEEARRAINMGAIGYLAKPTSFQEIARVWKESQGALARISRRVRSLGRALLIDPSDAEGEERGPSHLAWDIRNVSLTGAFLETKGPLPLRAELHLALAFGNAVGRVRAEVVRVQEPSWGAVGGAGIAFREFAEGTEALLTDYIARAVRRSSEVTAAGLVPSGSAS